MSARELALAIRDGIVFLFVLAVMFVAFWLGTP